MQQDAPKLRFATTRLASGLKVHYAEQGDPSGAAIVLVQGWPDSWFSFSRVLSLLATGYHAFAFDQRGFGDSERPACCYGIDDLAADVVAFLDAVGVERVSLVGHSLGSFIARRVAETHPERVARLMLIGSAATAANEVLLEVQASIRTLEDPVPAAFAREFQSSTAYAPLPEAFFEQIVAESGKLPARLWREVLDGVIVLDDAADLGRITAQRCCCGASTTRCSRARSKTAWSRLSGAPGCWCTRRRATVPTGSAPSGSPPTWTRSCGRGNRYRHWAHGGDRRGGGPAPRVGRRPPQSQAHRVLALPPARALEATGASPCPIRRPSQFGILPPEAGRRRTA
jgi:hypothetical protein